ncbi:MAG: hypothetical protein OXU81_13680 [Gammaproteobacteria bacterium]|nr:hypothetical protein [Gammaproteobacteria bacterium]
MSQGQDVTALELLRRMKSDPDGRWIAREMDRLSGIDTPGDVDPILARQFVYGRLMLEAAGVDFSETDTRDEDAQQRRHDA